MHKCMHSLHGPKDACSLQFAGPYVHKYGLTLTKYLNSFTADFMVAALSSGPPQTFLFVSDITSLITAEHELKYIL